MSLSLKSFYRLDKASKRKKAEDGERETCIIVREKESTTFKNCQISLPILSTPISSTVQLTKEGKMDVSPTNAISGHGGGKRTPGRKRKLKETIRRPVYLDDLIIGYETVAVSIPPKSPIKPVSKAIIPRRISKRKKYLSPIVRQLVQDNMRNKRSGASSRNKIESDDDDYNLNRLNSFRKEDSPVKTIIHLKSSDDIPKMVTIELKVHDDWEPDDKALRTSIPISGDNPFLQKFDKYDHTAKTCTDEVSLKGGPPPGPPGPLRKFSLEETGSELSPMSSVQDGCSSINDDEIIMKSTSINLQEEISSGTISNPNYYNHPSKFCNICGQEPISIDKPYKTFVQICEDEQHKVDDGKYYSCLTCNQRFSIFDLTSHEQECFVDGNDECYYFDEEINGQSHLVAVEEKTGGYRMVACENCVVAMSNR